MNTRERWRKADTVLCSIMLAAGVNVHHEGSQRHLRAPKPSNREGMERIEGAQKFSPGIARGCCACYIVVIHHIALALTDHPETLYTYFEPSFNTPRARRNAAPKPMMCSWQSGQKTLELADDPKPR